MDPFHDVIMNITISLPNIKMRQACKWTIFFAMKSNEYDAAIWFPRSRDKHCNTGYM